MKGDHDMPTFRLVPAEEPPADEPLRFPTEAVRLLNEARAALARPSSTPPSQPTKRSSADDVMDAMRRVSQRAKALTHELDVLGKLGDAHDDDDDDDDADDDRPRAA
jgi:hypothetical protein